jgi:hypothetical protein
MSENEIQKTDRLPKRRGVLAACAVMAISVTMASCSTGPAPQTDTAASSTSPSLSALRSQARSVKRDMDASGAATLPVTADRAQAEAAAQDGVPLALAYDSGPGSCSWLRLPDRSLWSLNSGGALRRDTYAEELFHEHPGAAVALACTDEPAPVGLDLAAADAADRSRVPYRWRDACHTLVRLPGSSNAYVLPDRLTTAGDALVRVPANYTCTTGGN